MRRGLAESSESLYFDNLYTLGWILTANLAMAYPVLGNSRWQGMLLDVIAACGVAECCYSCSLSAVGLE